MDALSRQEYPAILERLPPSAAAAKLNDRVKRIGKVNQEVADWLQERRKVELAYVAGLRKLVQRPLQDVGNDLGVFDGPWRKIVNSMEETATSHALLSERIEKDIEGSLRNFTSSNKEMHGMTTIQGNLNAMAKEVEDAKHNNEKVSRKGGKASSQKVDIAASKLQTAIQQWDAQAPFVFENLQSLDERRLNHLRDVLTQLQTHESDLVETKRISVEQTLTALLEIDTAQEIKNWAQAAVAGKSPLGDRKPVRQASTAGTTNESIRTETSQAAPPTLTPAATADSRSEHSTRQESMRQESFRSDSNEYKEQKEPKESKLKSRFGTMLSRRRQSTHGGFTREKSPSKGFSPLPFTSRNSASRDGRPSPSPRASSNNLRDSPQRDNRLSSLAESPTLSPPAAQTNGDTNGFGSFASNDGTASKEIEKPNGTQSPDLSNISPPPGPPPSQLKTIDETQKDAEGFSVPPPASDPISLAEYQAATENDQPQFKLDIRNEPIQEQDADAQAALSNVANTLRSSALSPPGRKVGTVRGRRDVRNTIYVPPPTDTSLGVASPDHYPPSPGIPAGRAAALAALSSNENAAPSVSDTTSIRSGHSLTNNAMIKHAEMHEEGLNASIIETISTSFENGVTKSMKISGEIALNQIKSGDDFSTPSNAQKIRINNFPNLEAIGPNRTFIQAASPDKPDEFSVDLTHVTAKPSVAFTYKVHIDDSNSKLEAPLLLKSAWKPQGDKLGVYIDYSLNPSWSTEPVSFTNLVLVATYTGAKAIGCQTKPTGTHLKEKSLVYWRLGNVTLGQDWQRIVCRFTGADGTAPEPGQIDARWEIHNASTSQGSGISLSRLAVSKGKEREESNDPFADDSISGFMNPAGPEKWAELEMSRKFVSGKYEAKQV